MSDKIDFNIKYGLIAVDKTNNDVKNIIHFAGFEEPPTNNDIETLRNELLTDEEFKLEEGTFYLEIADSETVDFFVNKIVELNGKMEHKVDSEGRSLVKWVPDTNEKNIMHNNKLGEELSELILAAASLSKLVNRIALQKIDGVDQKTLKTNIQSLAEECADVRATIRLCINYWNLNEQEINEREEKKLHFLENVYFKM